eukprot:962391-Rhodomonas_salina.1
MRCAVLTWGVDPSSLDGLPLTWACDVRNGSCSAVRGVMLTWRMALPDADVDAVVTHPSSPCRRSFRGPTPYIPRPSPPPYPPPFRCFCLFRVIA